MKAMLLARVSSKEQEEGQSIPAQERRLREYAERKGLTIDQVFKITESSTKDTRKEFEKILVQIRKSKERIALVADTMKGNKVARSQIDSILKNPFYCGKMRTKYGLAEHHYKPLISPSLFQQAQDVSAVYHKKPHKKISEPFILRGMISCAHCGCTVTPKIHKKRYIYYSCTNAKGICKKAYIREEPLVESLSQYFDHIALSEEQITDVTSYLKKIHESESLFHTESLMTLRKEQDRIQKRVSQMYDDKLDGLIDEKMYLEKVRDYKARQAEIVERMARHEKADQNFYVTANMAMNLAARAREIFQSSEVEEKRQLLNLVFQNLKLEGKNMSIDTCEPFTTLVDYKQCPKGWGRLDSNQRSPKARELQSLAIAAMRHPLRGCWQ